MAGKDSAEILMEPLGKDLKAIMKSIPKRALSTLTVYKIMIALIKRIRFLHELGYVHNDIKLENILVGKKDPENIYLIDFGLAIKYRE